MRVNIYSKGLFLTREITCIQVLLLLPEALTWTFCLLLHLTCCLTESLFFMSFFSCKECAAFLVAIRQVINRE